jgi:multidrug resistance protein
MPKRSVVLALVTFGAFLDIVAYSIAVPVLPDMTRRLGATPTTIGLLFASFGVTLFAVSIPMGAVSDRVGRKGPIVAGMILLAAASFGFALAGSLPLLFVARLMQGAADAMTWVVGFALIADLYGPAERGRVTGIVMSATSVAFMIGPTLGGWLYEVGGIRLPFFAVGAMAVVAAVGFAVLDLPNTRVASEAVPTRAVLAEPNIRRCALAVVAAAATLAMFEPVLALHLEARFGAGASRIGLVFGAGALANAFLHPMVGRAADRWGARRLMAIGMIATSCGLPLVARAWSFESAVAFFVLQAVPFALMVTPSLTLMAEATSESGGGSFGVAYGLYNMAWGVGLLCGPAIGGYLFERMGFERLALVWAPFLLLATLVVRRVQSKS